MNQVGNLDLLAVGFAIASIGILGFVVFFNNRKSITNRSFLLFALLTIFYGVVNYLNVQVQAPNFVLWFLRFTLFSAVWHAFSIFQLLYVFPNEEIRFPKWYAYWLFPITIFISILTLTPFVFSGVARYAPVGQVSTAIVEAGIYLFIVLVLLLVTSAITLLSKKTIAARGIEKTQYRFVFIGTVTTFSLIIIFNLILPAVFLNVRFIPLAPVFFFPFVGFTSYAIIKHHLLHTKVIATEILTFVLSVVAFSEVILAKDLPIVIFRSGVFALILIFGILLIRSVRREVEQREQLEKLSADLAAANRKLFELNRFKTQLLSLASHQIRSPLAAIKGFVSLILEGLYGPVGEKVKETLGKVRHSTDELVNLINTLLDLRKVEEGRMEYQFAKTEFKGLVQDVFDGLQPLAQEKKLEFTFESSEGEFFVSADAPKLRQVIQNLVDNAIKYTPAGFVKVALTRQGQEALLSVKDSGLGITPELVPQMFEEFVRDERVKQKIKGTGLGLYIARKIVEAHGGKVWGESEGEGKGSQFYLSLKMTP